MDHITNTKYITNAKYITQYSKYYKNNIYRNMISLKKMIFPVISGDKINQLLIDNESIKFITFASSAQNITNIIMNNLFDFPCPFANKEQKWKLKPLDKKMRRLVITEMTAGVGGNVLNFAKYFKYVNAIEIDTVRYNYLSNNVKLYEYNNVNCYNSDSIDLLLNKDDIVQDIIFFDPPWGGKDYKLFVNLRLRFGMFSIENICNILFQNNHNKIIVLKLPNNYDFDYLYDELQKYRVFKIVLDKMTIIVIKNYPYENIN